MTSPVDTPAEFAGATYEAALREKAAELKQELVRQNLDDLDSWHKALRHEWQLAHPELPSAPIPPEEMVAYSDTIRDEYYEWVVPAFGLRWRYTAHIRVSLLGWGHRLDNAD